MRNSTTLGALVALLALTGNTPPQGAASEATAARNAAVAESLPLDDQSDFDDARRGLLAQLDGDILNPDGSVSWSVNGLDFLDAEAPATVNPSLWRQSQLTAIHGLFEVVPGIYQIRGYDLSVMTLIAGQTGWIVIDPLLTAAPAKAGLELANRTLGEKPVVAVIYTHSHADHFGGVLGVTTREALSAGEVQIIAPEGFTAETVGESVLAGPAMGRRAQYQFGAKLADGPESRVGVGLGAKLSTGAIGLLPPTRELGAEDERLVIDGIVFDFLDAGGTEAPSEFVFYLPQFRALHTAEVATRNFHNILTPRGALVRDALKWSRTLDAILTRFGSDSDVMLASHHWPAWGADNVREKLRNQRDTYRFTHDQTLRLANQGYTMDEIAELIGEPDFAKGDFGTRGYYGTYQHNAKAVYQRYFGWWNAVPADYDALPKVEEARANGWTRWAVPMPHLPRGARPSKKVNTAGEQPCCKRWSLPRRTMPRRSSGLPRLTNSSASSRKGARGATFTSRPRRICAICRIPTRCRQLLPPCWPRYRRSTCSIRWLHGSTRRRWVGPKPWCSSPSRTLTRS